jgi:polar amino acid transport system substrate-binding protein
MKVSLFRVNQLLMCLMILGINLGAPIGSSSNETQPVVSKKFKQTLEVPSIPDNTLTAGWFDSEPYYTLIKSEGGFETYSGLDAELARAITQQFGYKISLKPIEWSEQIENLKTGKQHFAASATFTEERAKFVYFSDPYRREENSFFVRKGEGGVFKFNSGDMNGFIQSLKASKAKIAITDGMVYAAQEINDFVNDPENKPYLITTETTYDSIDLLLKGEIDGILDDRVITSAGIWRTKNSDKIEEVYLGIGTPIHYMFSKASVPESVVAEFNKALKTIQSDGTYSRIVRDYMFPILILQTIERPWFFFLEAFAIMALVISGLLIAYRERFNLYGTMMIAFVSMSGGIMRDIMVNRPKLGIMLTPIYAIGIFLSVLIGFVLVWAYQLLFNRKVVNETLSEKKWHVQHRAKIVDWLIELLDAVGLAAYTVTGVVIALISQLEPLWLWGPILAVLTTTGGGIMRDIIRGHKDIPTLKSDFYGEVAIIWGLILSLVFTWNVDLMSPEAMFKWIILVVIGSFTTRIIVKITGFKGLPFNLKGA